MKKSTNYRKVNGFKSMLGDILFTHKKVLILVLICCLFGIIVGTATCVGGKECLELENCCDKNLIVFMQGNCSILRFFFCDVIAFAFSLLLIFFLCNIKILFPICFCLLIYKSFCLAFNFCLFVILFGLGGLLFSIIFFLIFGLAMLFLLILALHICYDKSRFSCNPKNYYSSCLQSLVVILIVYLVLTILKILLLKLISPIFIIII